MPGCRSKAGTHNLDTDGAEVQAGPRPRALGVSLGYGRTMSKAIRILVTGAGGPGTVNLCRSLRRAPEPIVLIGTDCDRAFATLSLCDEVHLVPRASEEEAFSRRLEELDTEKNPKNIERLRKDMQRAEDLAIQRTFYSYLNREHQNKRDELRVALAAAEWERQHSQIVLLKKRLEAERERILERVIPDRYSLSSVDVWPVAVRFVVRGG